MTKERLRERFPLWGKSGRYVDGYYSSNHAGWVESGEVMKVLTKMAERAGVVMHECVGVREVLYETDPVQRRKKAVGIVTSTNHAFYGDHVLVAAGAWTPTLLPELRGVMWGSGQPVFHLKRLSRTEGGPKDGPDPLFLSDKYPMFFADIAKTGWYGFPSTADGLLKIGNHGHGYKMAAGYPKLLVPPAEVERFKQFLAESLPDLAQLPIVNTRLCLYCDTFDGDFFISRSPHVDGLSVAAGDSGHGFKFAPVIGTVIADVVEGKANKIAPRFAWRTNIEQDHSTKGGVSSRPKEPPKVNPYERSLVASNL
ncbi:N-methyl-L-tryptophan oxidase, variant 2 [Balamuthia mandrillaris]